MSIDESQVLRALAAGPSTAREIAKSLGVTRSEVNAILYSARGRIGQVGTSDRGAPLWAIIESSAPPAPTMPAGQAVEAPPRSKAAALKAILQSAGSERELTLGPGSTEPKALFVEVNRLLGLHLDESSSKVDMARTIVAAAGKSWPTDGDSRSTPSGGGDTVTLPGLVAVLDAVRSIRVAGPMDLPAGAPPEQAAPKPYVPASGGIEAPTARLEHDWDALDRATRSHANLQNAIAEAVLGAGLVPLSPRSDEPAYDLAWRSSGRFVVCEVKSATLDNVVQQVRLGLGQVIEYRRALQAEHADVVAALACELEPPPSTARAVSSVGVRLIRAASLEDDLRPLLD